MKINKSYIPAGLAGLALVALLITAFLSPPAPPRRATTAPSTAQHVQQVVQTQPAKRQWYGRNVAKSACIESHSPAYQIRKIQDFGQTPRVNDLPDGVVQVSRELSDERIETWTFFPTMTACESTLPRNQGINSKYE